MAPGVAAAARRNRWWEASAKFPPCQVSGWLGADISAMGHLHCFAMILAAGLTTHQPQPRVDAGGSPNVLVRDILQIKATHAGLNLASLALSTTWVPVRFQGGTAIRFTGRFTTRGIESLMGKFLATIYLGRRCRTQKGWSKEKALEHINELLACADSPTQVTLHMLFVKDHAKQRFGLAWIDDSLIDDLLLRAIAANLERQTDPN